MNIVNLTPHDLHVVVAENNIRLIPKSGAIARVATTRAAGEHVDGIPTFLTTFGAVEGLPDPSPDTVYIVSYIVSAQCAHRADVFAPGELVRDSNGNVVGCRGLSRESATNLLS